MALDRGERVGQGTPRWPCRGRASFSDESLARGPDATGHRRARGTAGTRPQVTPRALSAGWQDLEARRHACPDWTGARRENRSDLSGPRGSLLTGWWSVGLEEACCSVALATRSPA